MKKILLIICYLQTSVWACPLSMSRFHMNENYVYEGLNEQEFESGIKTFTDVFSPIVKLKDKDLVVTGKWPSEMNMAWTQQGRYGFYIDIYGGLARNQFMNMDALLFTLCHELGHHLGGHPKNVHPNISWSSVEGQADYYAAVKCMPKLLDEVAEPPLSEIPEALKLQCKEAWTDKNKYQNCVRIGLAGYYFVRSMSTYPEPFFDKPDTTEVELTYEDHPQSQCRLDTVLQGALCNSIPDEDVVGCSSSGTPVELRPRCWFKPTTR